MGSIGGESAVIFRNGQGYLDGFPRSHVCGCCRSKFNAVGQMDFNPNLLQSTVSGVLHRASEFPRILKIGNDQTDTGPHFIEGVGSSVLSSGFFPAPFTAFSAFVAVFAASTMLVAALTAVAEGITNGCHRGSFHVAASPQHQCQDH